jgi:GNAT superfamily N-acetyltransferase
VRDAAGCPGSGEDRALRSRVCTDAVLRATGTVFDEGQSRMIMSSGSRPTLASGAGDSDRAGSTADAERVTLRNGATIVVRPLAAGDEAAITSWFAGLGAETRYARFFGWLDRLDRRTRLELVRVDHRGREAITARAVDGTTVGIARYIRLGESRAAEVAVAVADDWSGQGVATLLLERVAAKARAVGIQQFTAACLVTNRTVIRLLSRLGTASVGPPDAGIVTIRIDLTRRHTAEVTSAPGRPGRRT